MLGKRRRVLVDKPSGGQRPPRQAGQRPYAFLCPTPLLFNPKGICTD
ncbi:hypothetical protein ACP70R_037206 [Stipagrostis hirtigluma subsp. patula]